MNAPKGRSQRLQSSALARAIGKIGLARQSGGSRVESRENNDVTEAFSTHKVIMNSSSTVSVFMSRYIEVLCLSVSIFCEVQ